MGRISPPEVLENVLIRVPAHVLWRFRVVCQKWNHLITQPGFASLRANVPRQASSILITPRMWEGDPVQQDRNARKKLGNTYSGEAVLWSPCKRKQLVKVFVWEILLGEKEDVKRAEMPQFWKYTREVLNRPLAVRGNAVVALRCGDSRVISSLLGCHVE